MRQKKSARFHLVKKKGCILFFVVVGIFLIIFSRVIFSGFGILYGLFFQKGIVLKGQENATNILLLGIGGGKHDGPDLTDTIILAHIDPVKNSVTLFSIPRDLWIPQLKSKINRAYSDGQDRGNKGILLTKSVIEKVTGQTVNYVVVVDFSGFISLVDQLGGVDVTVERTFDDYLYPVEGKESDLCGKTEDDAKKAATASAEVEIAEIFPCRYKHIHFDKGIQHMDGETALEFVRSRHSDSIEGSDFARSQRQHAVLTALKTKIFSLGLLLNPVKLIGIYNTIKSNTNTDIVESEYDDFMKLAKKMEQVKSRTYVIDTGDANRQGLLINPPISEETKFQWVLSPRVGNGDFSEIRKYIECIENGNICDVTKNGIEIPTPTVRINGQ